VGRARPLAQPAFPPPPAPEPRSPRTRCWRRPSTA
jgi:hypothetical protein